MSAIVKNKTNLHHIARLYRKRRIRKRINGTAECPRLSVFKSDRHFVIQLIDDEKSHTVLQVSTLSKELKGKATANIEGAKTVGKLLAEKAKKANISTVVFDRNGYKFHGSVKALADSAREAGLKF
jgi:large subunit ribosomal protein L18